ncbi:unnamed protein product [Gongylonema pulchrum]|uniref:Dynein associated protein domain-containing protein n=1 Tax=Gongylonema pulchrum TaxID=637853 RepID=A0A3P7MV37_9BILA|nr:unnamed protein product [Gongylonema pulchrum]
MRRLIRVLQLIDAKLCAIQLNYEVEFSNHLKTFLPDNFSKHGGKLYPLASGGMRPEHVTKSHKAEQWAHCAKFAFLLSVFGSAVRKFFGAVRLCSVERLSRLAQLQTDIAKEERMIDQYIDLLKSDKFDENTSCDSVDKGIAFFEVCCIFLPLVLVFFCAAD